jgi:hypothetical protein
MHLGYDAQSIDSNPFWCKRDAGAIVSRHRVRIVSSEEEAWLKGAGRDCPDIFRFILKVGKSPIFKSTKANENTLSLKFVYSPIYLPVNPQVS